MRRKRSRRKRRMGSAKRGRRTKRARRRKRKWVIGRGRKGQGESRWEEKNSDKKDKIRNNDIPGEDAQW